MAPLFSVIIPTFERTELLKLAMESVLDQSVQDFECLVIDDASINPVQPFGDDRVKVIRRRQRGGPAAARNTGIESASGRYVMFLDDDDLYTPDRLEIALDALDRAPLSICLGTFIGSQPTRGRHWEGNVHDVILDRTTPHLGTVTVIRDRLLPLNPEYEACEDIEWWLRISRDLTVTTIARLGYLLRQHDEPRGMHGTEARVAFSLRLLDEYAPYFATHPQAAAFRWRRIGLMLAELGDKQGAQSAFMRSLRRRPTVRSAWHLSRGILAATKPHARK